MAVRAYQSRLLVDGFDLSSNTSGATFTTDTTVLEYSNFQTAAVSKIAGNAGAIIEHKGYFTGGAAGSVEKVIKDRLATTDTVYTSVVFGTSETRPWFYTLDPTYSDGLTFDMPVEELLMVSGKWQQMGRTVAGYLLYTGTISGTGASTALDFLTAGAAGGLAYVHITAVVGTATSAAIQIQSATDSIFTTPNTRGTATFSGNSTTGKQAVRVSLGSGTVDRYLRINTTSMGGATSFTVVALVGVSGVTY
jgi:hypothetical protein